MQPPTRSTHGLARQIVAASRPASDLQVHEPELVIEKLRLSLIRLAGVEGFTSLLRRALTLAGAELPGLQGVKVSAEGTLDGMERLGVEQATGTRDEAAVAVTAHLLGLLVTFVGEPITLRLVREAWPDMPLDDDTRESEAD